MQRIARALLNFIHESWALLKLAIPLVLSNAFFTLQLTIDRIMLQDSNAVGAAMFAAVLYWTPLALLQQTAAYATTFVAQYVGAGRKERVGPSVWQSLYFSVAAGVGFLLVLPLIRPLMFLTGHTPEVQELETIFLQCLAFWTLPILLIASVNSFFAGRGDNLPVLIINIVGCLVTVTLDYAWINGHWGFPAWGIAGAGWATVCGSWAAAIAGLALALRKRYRKEFETLSGYRFDWPLFKRLMRFGIPSGMQYSMEALAFAIFLMLVGQLGAVELGATSIAFTINMTALVPMVGLAQAVSVLVGQWLGSDRPDLAAKTTLHGVVWCLLYTLACAMAFAFLSGPLLAIFEDKDADRWASIVHIAPTLLKFVAVYCLFESVSLILSAALRGAGDTRFVSAVTLIFSWTVMVVPTIVARYQGWGLYPVWIFATSYLIVLSFVFIWRFRQGKWRSMRVIETTPSDHLELPGEIVDGETETNGDNQPADEVLVEAPRPARPEITAHDRGDRHCGDVFPGDQMPDSPASRQHPHSH